MKAQRPTDEASYFLLSWTLTQGLTQEAFCGINHQTILNLAAKTYPSLYNTLLPSCSADTYPNIIYVDAIHDTNVAALAVAINTLFPYTPKSE